MDKKKDWSYFEHTVGRYEPRTYYSLAKKEFVKEEGFVPYKPETKKLVWYVFEEDANAKKIIPFNVFEGSYSFIDGLLYAKKKYKDNFIKFAHEVRSQLLHSYWSKSEWETIITTWPPRVGGKEIDRLINEKEEHIEKYGTFNSECINLEVSHKIDVYTQVMMNWDRFIEYVWNNKRLITEKKLWGK